MIVIMPPLMMRVAGDNSVMPSLPPAPQSETPHRERKQSGYQRNRMISTPRTRGNTQQSPPHMPSIISQKRTRRHGLFSLAISRASRDQRGNGGSQRKHICVIGQRQERRLVVVTAGGSPPPRRVAVGRLQSASVRSRGAEGSPP